MKLAEIRVFLASWWSTSAWPRLRAEGRDYLQAVGREPLAHLITATLIALVAFLWP